MSDLSLGHTCFVSVAQSHMPSVQVAVIVDGVTKKAAEIATVKDDAERDLAAAKPALDAALSALNSITQKDIVGLKALKNPPDIVKRIFDAVLLLRYLPAAPLSAYTPHAKLLYAVLNAQLLLTYYFVVGMPYLQTSQHFFASRGFALCILHTTVPSQCCLGYSTITATLQ